MLREPAIPTPEPPPSLLDEGYSPIPPAAPAAALSLIERRPPASGPPAPVLSAFLVTIDRLEQLIEQETRELGHLKPMDLREFNRRKSQGLLELSRALRGLGDKVHDDRVPQRLAQLRGRLDHNLAALRMHLRAAQEVTSIIARAIQDAESDGTYSASIGTKSR
jgi:hypothetical protein